MLEESKTNHSIKVLYIVPPNYGQTFNGQARIVHELLLRWNTPEVLYYIYDLANGVRNLIPGSGLAGDALFTKSLRNPRYKRFIYALRLLATLLLKSKHYDLIHVQILWWGPLLSPLVTHLLGKKSIYHMSLLSSDNPSAIAAEALGWLKLRLFKQFDGVIGLSPAMIEDCKKHNFSSELLVLPNFLPLDPGKNISTEDRLKVRRHLGLPENSQVILFTGSIIERKGVDLVVEVFKQLASEHPNLWLVLVGPKDHSENPRLDKPFIEHLQQELESAGIAGRTRWTGLINDPKVLVDYYMASDLFLFPTRAEGQGIVILEAMAAGLPIIATHLEGVTDMMVTSEVHGFLIPKDDLTGFVNATETLLASPELRQQMGSKARLTALQEFNFERYSQRLSNFYRQVLDKRNH